MYKKNVFTSSSPVSGEFFIGPVDIAVSPVIPDLGEGEVSPVFTHRISFNLTESEFYQLSLPFDESDFFVVLSTGTEQRSLRIGVSESGD